MSLEWTHVMWHVVDGEGGPAMCPYIARRPLDSEALSRLIELWLAQASAPTLDREAFCGAFDGAACADWGRMQPDGSSYGGAWDAPEGSPARRDAFGITWAANRRALAHLPYPPAVVLFAVGYLCPRRCESVARVADLLAWARAEARATRGIDLPLTPRGL